MRWGLWLFLAFLVVLHFILRLGLGLGHLAPDLLVVALLLAAREMRAGWAAGLGLGLGILDGSMVPFNLGASALVLTVIGFLGARTRELFAGDNFLFLALYLFVGKWLYDTLLYLVTGDLFSSGAAYLLLISPLTALYAAAAGVVALAAYRAFA
jgi:hypothetical protein